MWRKHDLDPQQFAVCLFGGFEERDPDPERGVFNDVAWMRHQGSLSDPH
jgi:hypothetical protein